MTTTSTTNSTSNAVSIVASFAGVPIEGQGIGSGEAA
jgi:hypothetical protein